MRKFNDYPRSWGSILFYTQTFLDIIILVAETSCWCCCSRSPRRTLRDKYDSEFCMFETTLYGSSKSSSMYDGMGVISKIHRSNSIRLWIQSMMRSIIHSKTGSKIKTKTGTLLSLNASSESSRHKQR